jgi:uncharacterized SAM-binding protein YcdF (DUF218 family)
LARFEEVDMLGLRSSIDRRDLPLAESPLETPDRCRALGAGEIEAITAAHFPTVSLKPADLLFVFGSREGVLARVDAAARLWRDGFFRWAIVSGGITPGSHMSECAVIKAAMVAAGIPSGVILEEHAATNTGENVMLSLPIIDAAIGLANIRRVICLGNAWTSRRYPMTLHRHWPEVEKMLVTFNPFETPVEFWHTDPRFRALVVGEYDKIARYLRSGFIAPWPDPG